MQTKISKNIIYNKAFTIVELLVVISILVILWTVWFVSYTNYIITSRDATRISQIQMINQAFKSFINKRPPLPDNMVTIYASWVIVWYQWYVWEKVLSNLWITEWWKDPLDNNYYTYFIDKNTRNIQLLAFFENNNNLSYNWFINQVSADLNDRIPKPYWSKLWLLIETGSNLPIQDNLTLRTNWLDIVTTPDSYKAYYTGDEYMYWTWIILQKLQQSIYHNWVWLSSPTSCPKWFIWVPGNLDYNQPGFCVMKYEASYETINNITTNDGTIRETDDYSSWKIDIVSKAWWYPIAYLTQLKAINLCKSMGDWYHLITNDEWMTIARNIELKWSNWSGNSAWSWFIYNGRSDDTIMWCDWNLDGSSAEPTWTECLEKRGDWKSRNVLTLSNWEEIRDLAWNVREHVNQWNTLDWSNYTILSTLDLCWGLIIDEWSECIITWDDVVVWWWGWPGCWRWGCWPWSGQYWNDQWVGWINNVTSNIFVRWWSALGASTVWIFALRLDWADDALANFWWFRCAK